MAILEECRASGCIATVGDQAHPLIVHRLEKEWVKIVRIGMPANPRLESLHGRAAAIYRVK